MLGASVVVLMGGRAGSKETDRVLDGLVLFGDDECPSVSTWACGLCPELQLMFAITMERSKPRGLADLITMYDDGS